MCCAKECVKSGREQAVLFLDEPTTKPGQAVLHYWQGLAGDGAMPDRATLRPADIKQHLHALWIMQVEAGGADFRVRLAGTTCVEVLGWDFTGQRLSQARPEQAVRWFPLYEQVVQTRRPLVFQTRLDDIGKRYRRIEALCLPFTRGASDVAEIVCLGVVLDRPF